MASVTNIGNDKYRVIISNGFNTMGNRIRITRTITAKSEAAAKAQAETMEDEAKAGKPELIHGNITFKLFADFYKKNHLPELAVKTAARYEDIIDDFLIPAFGKKLLREIVSHQVTEYISILRKDGIRLDKKPGGYSQKTILAHYQLFSSMMEFAIQNKLLSINPCTGIPRPKVPKADIKFYDREQTAILLEKLKTAPFIHQVYINMAVCSGARKSEMLGMEWQDIDFKRNLVHICRRSMYTPKEHTYTVNGTKNGDPSRDTHLPEGMMNMLKLWKEEQEHMKSRWEAKGNVWTNSNRLFINENGLPMHPDTPYQWFTRFLQRENLPVITIHGLRHTNITLLLGMGVDVKTLASEKGHDPAVLLSIYAHTQVDAAIQGANTLNSTFY